MATPDMDVIKEIPGYKVILKAVLKAQIQQLVEQLAQYTEEDSIILTASVHDGTLSHLGSDSGKSFLDDHEDVKSQFLGFCLKYHHKKKQEKEQREREEREEAMRKAAAAAVNTAGYSPRHSFMPTRPRHPSPRFMGSRHPLRSVAPRHQPYPVTRPIRGPAVPVSSPLKSPNKIDGQVIKIEPEDDDETSNQEASDSNVGDSESNVQNTSQSPSHSNQPSTPSKVKSESGDKDDDAKSESSSSTIPNEPASEGLGLDSDLSNLISGTSQQPTSESSELDPDVSVKLEALTENEMELEITGVEPGRPVVPQDNWDPNVSMGMNFDPTGATGNQGDLSAQGYNLTEDFQILVATDIQRPSAFTVRHIDSVDFEGETCRICNKVFPHNYHLRRHMKSHLQQRDFTCTICGQEFLLKHHLKNHLRSRHDVQDHQKLEFCMKQ